MAKKRLPAAPTELQGRAAAFFDTIKAESDRGCVLVAAAFLDEALELLLRCKMTTAVAVVKASVEPLFVGVGPIKSFWAKIELCRALRLISSQEHADLSGIRHLRNHFAHSYVDATFSDLKAIQITADLYHFGTRSFPLTEVEKRNEDHVRARFMLAAAWLAGGIHKRSGMVGDAA